MPKGMIARPDTNCLILNGKYKNGRTVIFKATTPKIQFPWEFARRTYYLHIAYYITLDLTSSSDFNSQINAYFYEILRKSVQ